MGDKLAIVSRRILKPILGKNKWLRAKTMLQKIYSQKNINQELLNLKKVKAVLKEGKNNLKV